MAVARNVVVITVDQYRGDSLSYLGHRVAQTPAIDQLCSRGVCFANHWSVTAPCGPGRASLYTGTYAHHHRSVLNGTPLDARFTNIALEARAAGYDPVLFGYTDTSIDPRTVAEDDARLASYEGVLPGFRPVVHDPFELGGLEWGRWLAERGYDVPSRPHDLYAPDTSYPGAGEHAPSWAPTLFRAEDSESAFLTEKAIEWLGRLEEPGFFLHLSYIRPHPPYRNPAGYHDLCSADEVDFLVGQATREAERASHPLARMLLGLPAVASPDDEGARRQLRATYHGMQAEVDTQLGRFFDFLEQSGLASETLILLTSDHGEMGGDHWGFQKAGYWDESFRVPLVVVDPSEEAEATRGRVVEDFTESVDVAPSLLEWLGLPLPRQFDGRSLLGFVRGADPTNWRTAAHFEWSFRNPATRRAETAFAIPSAHCSLAVLRTAGAKYVQFAADPELLPPIYFDLLADPDQLDDLSASKERAPDRLLLAEELSRWRMRYEDEELASLLLTADGVVSAGDPWR